VIRRGPAGALAARTAIVLIGAALLIIGYRTVALRGRVDPMTGLVSDYFYHGPGGPLFAFVGAHLDRQFEFVQRQWINDGKFIGAPAERDPLIGVQDSGGFTIPKQPIRRRLTGLPDFVVNRGGEYCFMPGLRALRWLADLNT
jgi:hypothetical protein